MNNSQISQIISNGLEWYNCWLDGLRLDGETRKVRFLGLKNYQFHGKLRQGGGSSATLT
ncbi:hypothetical protein Syun_003305 [Stephania yunnanensis]|uniref:Uncharacterized protein n=1 Tax=Stephania yunnanensis TaxID=152371 RepID=A0AAP0L0Y3_9MAGN